MKIETGLNQNPEDLIRLVKMKRGENKTDEIS